MKFGLKKNIHWNAFENIICKTLAILFWGNREIS